ncbi:DnaA regulatory inactivator Hda [Isoalcanivorax indicus]|uniref:DnaA regulatory inactivator Hda n=1 Tax=Isoalcanivorax indicus TaxID=2202653 RepID=UPI000DBAD35E|nr:DnaA regulatory inactivator Hda [Isoalcanivorax indicus]
MTAQLPLALRLREGFDLDSYAGAPGLAAAVQALVAGEWGQLYLHGPSGTGRTHLLSAAVRRAEEQGVAACLLPGEEMAHLTPDVLEAFDQYGLLAIDNVDALAGLPVWEEALFHLYNRCREAGAGLLFAALAPPVAAGFVLPDLASRLAAGPVYRLAVPDDAALADLLQRRAGRRGLVLGDEVAAYVVQRGERTPAALMALLETLDEHALARQRRLTIPFVKEVLGW